MFKLRILLAIGLATLMLGCTSFGTYFPIIKIPPFVRISEPVLGLNTIELKKVLGNPLEIREGKCSVPMQLEKTRVTIRITGDAWNYYKETKTARASLKVCIVNGYAVSQQRTLMFVEGRREFIAYHHLIDADLVEKAYRDELDEKSHDERILPGTGNEPKHEI